MKLKILVTIVLINFLALSQNFWVKTNFPYDSTSAYSVYSFITTSNNHLLAGTYTKGVYRSTDNGSTWTQSGLSGHWIVSLAKDSYGNLYTASIGSTYGNGVFKSTDNGYTWNKVWDALTGMNHIYVDQNNNIFVSLNYTSTQGGIYMSSNGGSNWNKIFFNTDNIYTLTRLSNGRILAASYGKVFYSDTDGNTWYSTTNGMVSSTLTAFAKNSQNEIFLASAGYGILKSTDNGVNWQNLTGAGWDYSSLNITANNILYAGTRGNWVYHSTDNGANWQLVNSGMNQDKYVLALHTNPAGYLFAGMDYYGLYRSVSPVVSSIDDNNSAINNFELKQNYPNPFNPSTTISWQMPSSGLVTIKLFNILGKEVQTIVNGFYEAGTHSIQFNVKSDLTGGVYFYQIKSGDYLQSKKMVLLK